MKVFANFAEAQAAYAAHRDNLVEHGIIALDSVQSYIPARFGSDYRFAMDAQPALIGTPNAGIPAFMTAIVDPQVFEILLAPNAGAQILPEVRKGDWTTLTAYFPTIERVGQVSSYGDYNENGVADVNSYFPTRQSYRFQVITQYGDLEIEQAGNAKINLVAAKDNASATALAKFSNLAYHFGVAGIECYGLLNDPGIAQNATLTPAVKANGGTKWMNGNVPNGSANEVFADIQSLIAEVVGQTAGLVDESAEMVLALPPGSSVALQTTNSYGLNVHAMLKENFPNLKVVKSPLYGAQTAQNPQGIAGGNMVQLWVRSIEGQDSGYVAFSEKMRQHRIVPGVSSYKQKKTAGTWGAVIRQPFACAQMLGV